MTYISIGMYGTFRDIGVIVQKFKNYLNKLQKLFIRNFSIFRGHCGLVSPCKKLANRYSKNPEKSFFLCWDLEILRPDFRYFAKLPHSGVKMHPSNFQR